MTATNMLSNSILCEYLLHRAHHRAIQMQLLFMDTRHRCQGTPSGTTYTWSIITLTFFSSKKTFHYLLRRKGVHKGQTTCTMTCAREYESRVTRPRVLPVPCWLPFESYYRSSRRKVLFLIFQKKKHINLINLHGNFMLKNNIFL